MKLPIFLLGEFAKSQGLSSSITSMTIRGTVKLCFFEFLFDVQKSSGGILNCFVKCWLLLSPLTTLVSFFLGRKLFRCDGKITEWMPFSTGLRGNWGITETISPYIGALQLSSALGPLGTGRETAVFVRWNSRPTVFHSLYLSPLDDKL